jgi:lipopolysaccharide transport system ATP-binding protein
MTIPSDTTLIEVQNLHKKFCRSLRKSLWYGVQDIASEMMGRHTKHDTLRPEEFWSLHDVSFSVKAGESLGLLGHNGAGKSTLLKLLNGLIKPDRGLIRVRGSMGALIELGVGFNPVLTGRENIYVSAAIRGIPKVEVDRMIDNIIDFADLEEFINTPVHSYSSGMRVRLGFAVAAQLEPNILLVDEVLAVGDIAFRAKCRKRIQELLQGGTSLMLVSHNLHDISYLCPRCLVMEKGKVIFFGETQAAIDVYRESLYKASMTKREQDPMRAGSGEIQISKFELLDHHNHPQSTFRVGDHVTFRIHYIINKPVCNPVFNVVIYALDGSQVTGLRNDVEGLFLGDLRESGYIDIAIQQFNLLANIYTLDAGIFDTDGYTYFDRIERIAQIKVVGGHSVGGVIYLSQTWHQQTTPMSTSQPILAEQGDL